MQNSYSKTPGFQGNIGNIFYKNNGDMGVSKWQKQSNEFAGIFSPQQH